MLRGSIIPNKVSVRGFQRLQRLRFPVELAAGHIAATTGQISTQERCLWDNLLIQERCPWDNLLVQHGWHSRSLFEDLVPVSVSQLSLLSRGTDSHRKVIDATFCPLITRRLSHLPTLREVEIKVRGDEYEANENQRARLRMEMKKVGVILRALP